jgi:RNA polymerase sigma-70 factor (ECF subfamily)
MAAHEDFLQLFDPDSDRAAEKYAELFLRLVKFFEWRNCRSPEDLAQETLARGLTNVSRGADIYTDDPAHYFYGIAKNIVREDRRPRDRESSISLDEVPDPSSLHFNQVDAQIQLDQCLRRLPPTDRDLLVRFHTEDHQVVCRQLSLTANALRVRAHRARKKLLKLVQDATERVGLVK